MHINCAHLLLLEKQALSETLELRCRWPRRPDKKTERSGLVFAEPVSMHGTIDAA
jgi:hypothetical protein